MTEQGLPSNKAMEQEVIAALLVDPEAIDAVIATGLKTAHFHYGYLGQVYQAMLDLHKQDQDAGFVTVCDTLERRGHGPPAADLAGYFENQVTSMHVCQHARTVRTYAHRRKLLAVGQRLAVLAHGDGTPDEFYKSASGILQKTIEGLKPRDQTARNYSNWADLSLMLTSIEWQWSGWAPSGFLVEIVGYEEVGKSALALRIAGSYIMGWDWPDGRPYTGETGSVVWAEGEAGQQLNINRAEAWGIDASKIITPHIGLGDFHLANQEHRDAFWYLMHQPHIKAGFVDSLSGIHEGKENAAAMQRVIKPFAELGRDTGKVPYITHHLNKPLRGQQDILTLHRVRGSSTITQTARVVWGIDCPDTNRKDTRRLQMLKCNLGLKPEPLGFTIGNDGLTFCDAPMKPRRETLANKAADLLLTLLRKGPRRSTAVREEIEAVGLSWDAAKRAKRDLEIVATRKGGVWYWGLPAYEQEETV